MVQTRNAKEMDEGQKKATSVNKESNKNTNKKSNKNALAKAPRHDKAKSVIANDKKENKIKEKVTHDDGELEHQAIDQNEKSIFENSFLIKRLLSSPVADSNDIQYGVFYQSLENYLNIDGVVSNQFIEKIASRRHKRVAGLKDRSLLMVAVFQPMSVITSLYEKKQLLQECYDNRLQVNEVLLEFFKANFFIDDEIESSYAKSISSSVIMMIYKSDLKDFSITPRASEIYAVCNFFNTEQSIFINHIAVNLLISKQILKTDFKKVTDNDFLDSSSDDLRCHGLGTCLLSMVQIFASRVDLIQKKVSSPDKDILPMYLQVMVREPATIQFYVRNGFREKYIDTLTSEEREKIESNRQRGDAVKNIIIHKRILDELPQDLLPCILPDDIDIINPTYGIVLEYVSNNNYECPMILMCNKDPIKLHHVMTDRLDDFKYGEIDDNILKERHPNSSVSIKDLKKDILNFLDNDENEENNASTITQEDSNDMLPPTCGSCGKQDNAVLYDLKCVYCGYSQHPNCSRRTQHQDRLALRYSLGIGAQNINSHPYYVVCKKCDLSRLSPSSCNCRAKATNASNYANSMPVVCYQYRNEISNSSCNKCIKCRKPIHVECAKWVNCERTDTRNFKVPICLPCEHEIQKNNILKIEEDGMHKIRDRLMKMNISRTEKSGFPKGFHLSGVSATLGGRHDIEQYIRLYKEDNWKIRNISRRVPFVGPLELQRFVDPSKELYSIRDKSSPRLYVSNHSRHFAPVVHLHEGAYLWRSTWVNDSIITAYTAICNALTETNKNCICLGTEFTHWWESDSAVEQRIGQLHEERAQDEKRMTNSCKGNIGQRLLNNRLMNIDEIFELGYKAAYFVFNSGGNHYFGVVVIPDDEEQSILKYQVIDPLAGATDLSSMKLQHLERFFQSKFEPRYVMQHMPSVETRSQNDTDSCGVQQCKFMEDLALGNHQWRTVPCNVYEINHYRLVVARRILNFEGTQHNYITKSRNLNKDYYIRSEEDELKHNSNMSGPVTSYIEDNDEDINTGQENDLDLSPENNRLRTKAALPITPEISTEDVVVNQDVQDNKGNMGSLTNISSDLRFEKTDETSKNDSDENDIKHSRKRDVNMEPAIGDKAEKTNSFTEEENKHPGENEETNSNTEKENLEKKDPEESNKTSNNSDTEEDSRDSINDGDLLEAEVVPTNTSQESDKDEANTATNTISARLGGKHMRLSDDDTSSGSEYESSSSSESELQEEAKKENPKEDNNKGNKDEESIDGILMDIEEENEEQKSLPRNRLRRLSQRKTASTRRKITKLSAKMRKKKIEKKIVDDGHKKRATNNSKIMELTKQIEETQKSLTKLKTGGKRIVREALSLQKEELSRQRFAKKPRTSPAQLERLRQEERERKEIAKQQRHLKKTRGVKSMYIEDEEVIKECEERLKEQRARELKDPKKEREKTYDEMKEHVAKLYFDNQWLEYEEDQKSNKKIKKKKPEARTFEEFIKKFDDLIMLWRDDTFLKGKGFKQTEVRSYIRHLNDVKHSVERIIHRETQLQLSELPEDNRQVVSMKYVKARKNASSGTDRISITPAHFVGALQHGVQEKLNADWVEENVAKTVLGFLRNHSGMFYRLPPGSIHIDDGPSEPLQGRWEPPPRPIVPFRQGNNNTCVYHSFASCLYYLGIRDLAKYVNEKARKESTKVDNLERLIKTVHTFRKKEIPYKHFKNEQYDLLTHNGDYEDARNPTVYVLQGEDGNCEHAITVTGPWIFDSNLKNAIPLTQNSLNWCVMGKFVCVRDAIRFYFQDIT